MNTKETVLFVDDEPELLDGLRDALRKEPYEIVTATSPSEGLRVLHERRIDVVVSDERMPGVSGADFLAFVRQRFPDTVRIMLTGQASFESALQAINEGEIYRILTKPCSPQRLSRTLRDALVQRGLLREGARLLALVKRQRRLLAELGYGSAELDGAAETPVRLDAAQLVLEMQAEAALEAADRPAA